MNTDLYIFMVYKKCGGERAKLELAISVDAN